MEEIKKQIKKIEGRLVNIADKKEKLVFTIEIDKSGETTNDILEEIEDKEKYMKESKRDLERYLSKQKTMDEHKNDYTKDDISENKDGINSAKREITDYQEEIKELNEDLKERVEFENALSMGTGRVTIVKEY